MEDSNVISAVGDTIAQDAQSLIHLDELRSLFTVTNLARLIASAIVLVIGFVIYRLVRRFALKKARATMKPQAVAQLSKMMAYVFYILAGLYILGLAGVNLSAVWGAAGVAGLAIGFAAQTSASNLISGLFITLEKTMKIGDFITVNGASGTVDSIGPLSVGIHTADNQLVRIPNSSILGNNLTNFSTFPLRRLTIIVPISYESDPAQALKALSAVPERCALVLTDPKPQVFFDSFDSSVTLKLCLWIKSADHFPARNEVYVNVMGTLKEYGVIIPYTRFDIKIVEDDGAPLPHKA